MAVLQEIVPIVLLVSLTFSAGLMVNRAAMLDTIKRKAAIGITYNWCKGSAFLTQPP